MKHLTRIFNVEYSYQEFFNGKKDRLPLNDNGNFVAKNAQQAIEKARITVSRECYVIDGDATEKNPRGRKITVTIGNFDVQKVKLVAEA